MKNGNVTVVKIMLALDVMTFLVTQEVSLMALVKFHYSLSCLGNAISHSEPESNGIFPLMSQDRIPYECE